MVDCPPELRDLGKRRDSPSHALHFDNPLCPPRPRSLPSEIGKDLDPLDLVGHVACDGRLLTRRERANDVPKKDDFARCDEQEQGVLEALLARYTDEGSGPIEDIGVSRVQPLNGIGTPVEIIRLFGGRDQHVAAVGSFESMLNQPAA